MIVQCDRCHVQLDLSNINLPESQSRIRCGGCQHEFDFRAQLQPVAPTDSNFKGLKTGPTLASHRDAALSQAQTDGGLGQVNFQSFNEPPQEPHQPPQPLEQTPGAAPNFFNQDLNALADAESGAAPSPSVPSEQDIASFSVAQFPENQQTLPDDSPPSFASTSQMPESPEPFGLQTENENTVGDFLVPNRTTENESASIQKQPSIAGLKKTSSGFFDALQIQSPEPPAPSNSFAIPSGEVEMQQPAAIEDFVNPPEPQSETSAPHLQFSLPSAPAGKEDVQINGDQETSNINLLASAESETTADLEFDPESPSGLSLELDNVENSDKFKIRESGSFSLSTEDGILGEPNQSNPSISGANALQEKEEPLEQLSWGSELPQLTNSDGLGGEYSSPAADDGAHTPAGPQELRSAGQVSVDRGHGSIEPSAMQETMRALESSVQAAQTQRKMPESLSAFGRFVSVSFQLGVFAVSVFCSIYFTNGGELQSLQERDWRTVSEVLFPSSKEIAVYGVKLRPYRDHENSDVYIISGYVKNQGAQPVEGVEVTIRVGDRQLTARAGIPLDLYGVYSGHQPTTKKENTKSAQTTIQPGERARFAIITDADLSGRLGEISSRVLPGDSRSIN